jgi:hypothetical protein
MNAGSDPRTNLANSADDDDLGTCALDGGQIAFARKIGENWDVMVPRLTT